MSAARYEIERIAVTLYGVSAEVGERAAAQLDGVLKQRLSALKLSRAGISVGHADLGVIEAAAGTDAEALNQLIAARLVDWLGRQSGDQTRAAAAGDAAAEKS